MAGLNPSQREAVAHGGGPLLIVAGAGTGKTKTLACRVAHLVHEGVDPSRILLLTFTRRASEQMLRRASQMVGGGAAGKVWGGTFHSTANRLLRMYGRALGLSPDFTVMDESDAADLMSLIRNELGVAKKDRRFPSKATLVKVYSHTVNAQRQLEAVIASHFPWCKDDFEAIQRIFRLYVQRKRRQQVLDYDDLLLFWNALCGAAKTGEVVADRFEHILVDEYQDTNIVQAEILMGMRKKHNNITVVGDDAQAIYSFRAATIRNILDFPKHFPGATVVTLEQNYRSVKPILTASNAVMAGARERYTKGLWSERESAQRPFLVTCFDEAEQTEMVCTGILEHLEQGIPLQQQAVLFRAGHHSAMLEVELARRNIPFHKYGGLRFVETAHIKDLVSVLRLVENPFDEISWFRVLQLLEGIGPRTARRVMDALGVTRPEPGADGDEQAIAPANPLRRLIADPPQVPAAARESFANLCATIRHFDTDRSSTGGAGDDLRAGGEPELAVQIDLVRRFYEPICTQRYENAPARLRDLEQLGSIASRYRSRRRFLTDLTLDPPAATSDLAREPYLEEDYLILSTIHSAKGCEWTVVHILHAADGMIPSDMAVGDEAGVDEERRLFYVAMTRAKDWLYVYFPLRYYHSRFGSADAHGLAQLTRFISGRVRAHFEPRAGAGLEERLRLDSAARNPYARIAGLLGE